MVTKLKGPGGALIEVADEAVGRFLAAGWLEATPPPTTQPEPKPKRRARRTTKAKAAGGDDAT